MLDGRHEANTCKVICVSGGTPSGAMAGQLEVNDLSRLCQLLLEISKLKLKALYKFKEITVSSL